MENIIDYARNEFLSFSEKPLNRVDSLIFSSLTYLPYEEIYKAYYQRINKPDTEYNFFYCHQNRKKEPKKLYFYNFIDTAYFKNQAESDPSDDTYRLLRAVINSPRFRTTKIAYYSDTFDSDLEMQFSAVTFFPDDGSAYIAFRGTDSSFVGWKEDFNMSYLTPVPAQAAASLYVNCLEKYLPKKIYIGGHSKGGNLAVYATMKANEKIYSKITTCFSHDGPGFRRQVVESDEFLKIQDKINKTVPEDSIVGMLLQTHEKYQVIKSSGELLAQHNPFTWEVLNTDFIDIADRSAISRFTDGTLNSWLSTIDDDKRKNFINALYKVVSSTKASNVDELKSNWKENLPKLLLGFNNLDYKSKSMLSGLFARLAQISWEGLSKNYSSNKNLLGNTGSY